MKHTIINIIVEDTDIPVSEIFKELDLQRVFGAKIIKLSIEETGE